MNFGQAIQKLNDGWKITRDVWKDECHFQIIEEGRFKAYKKTWRYYHFTSDIILSQGWIISDMPGTHDFAFMIDALKDGHHAKLEDWGEGWIYMLDKEILYKTIVEYDHMFVTEDFLAKDWMVVK